MESLRKQGSVSTAGLPSRVIEKESQKSANQLASQNDAKGTSLKSILKSRKTGRLSQSDEHDEFSSPLLPSEQKSIPRGVRDKLAADDAEIAALEKALGVKDKKKLPKSFEDDGLDVLLNGLEDEPGGDGARGKRKRDEGDEWLEQKRKKARRADRDLEPNSSAAMSDSEEPDDSFDGLSDAEMDPEEEDLDVRDDDSSADGESDNGFSSQDSNDPSAATISAKKSNRENPYRAPFTSAVAAPKYVPPSLRNQHASETEDLSRLRRQTQGLINRLSEANVISILGDIESLYRDNPRQHVSSTLLDLLLGLLSDPAPLQDTFVILHAGFIASVYKIIGPDFGADVVQRVDEIFRENEVARDDGRNGKRFTNLASLLSALYTFQVIGSKLIYDYIKMFIEDLSEEKAELLLKILRSKYSSLAFGIYAKYLDFQTLDHSYGKMILQR